jgi:hypothetical protein
MYVMSKTTAVAGVVTALLALLLLSAPAQADVTQGPEGLRVPVATGAVPITSRRKPHPLAINADTKFPLVKSNGPCRTKPNWAVVCGPAPKVAPSPLPKEADATPPAPRTPEPTTTVVIAYLLTFAVGGPPPAPFAFVTIPSLPSLQECEYLAHELIVSDNPSFKCTGYQMAIGASAGTSGIPRPRPRPDTALQEANAPIVVQEPVSTEIRDYYPEGIVAIRDRPENQSEARASNNVPYIASRRYSHIPPERSEWKVPGHPKRCIIPGTGQITERCSHTVLNEVIEIPLRTSPDAVSPRAPVVAQEPVSSTEDRQQSCGELSCWRWIPGNDGDRQSLAVTRPLKGDDVAPGEMAAVSPAPQATTALNRTPDPEPQELKYRASLNLNLRASPDATSANSLGRWSPDYIPQATIFVGKPDCILKGAGAGWCKVTYNHDGLTTTGWANGWLLEKLKFRASRNLNLHESPDAKSTNLLSPWSPDYIPQGTEFGEPNCLLEGAGAGWCKITFNHHNGVATIGWVNGWLLERIP